jgi:hypothetical protein
LIRENTEAPYLVRAYYWVIGLVRGRYGWLSALNVIPGGLVQSRRLDCWIGRVGQLCSPAPCSF